MDKDLGHQPRYLNRAAVAQHAQCLVVAREAVVRSGEVHQKTAARLEAQSTAVDGMRESAFQDTQRVFQTMHEAIDRKKEELCNRIVTVLNEKKHTIAARAQSCNKEVESLTAAQTALSFLLTKGSSHEVVGSKRLAHVRQSAATSQCRGGGGGVPTPARGGSSDSHQGVRSHPRWRLPSPLHSGPQTRSLTSTPSCCVDPDCSRQQQHPLQQWR